eukprot:3753094-Karenia_brevis.AAC.1
MQRGKLRERFRRVGRQILWSCARACFYMWRYPQYKAGYHFIRGFSSGELHQDRVFIAFELQRLDTLVNAGVHHDFCKYVGDQALELRQACMGQSSHR